MGKEGGSRSVEVAMAVGSDQLTTVANTSIPARNHTSMKLEVFAHGGVTPVGSHPQTPCKDRLTPYIVRIGPACKN